MRVPRALWAATVLSLSGVLPTQAGTRVVWEETPTHKIKIKYEDGREVGRWKYAKKAPALPGASVSDTEPTLEELTRQIAETYGISVEEAREALADADAAAASARARVAEDRRKDARRENKFAAVREITRRKAAEAKAVSDTEKAATDALYAEVRKAMAAGDRQTFVTKSLALRERMEKLGDPRLEDPATIQWLIQVAQVQAMTQQPREAAKTLDAAHHLTGKILNKGGLGERDAAQLRLLQQQLLQKIRMLSGG